MKKHKLEDQDAATHLPQVFPLGHHGKTLEAKTHCDEESRRESRVKKKVTVLALLISVQVFRCSYLPAVFSIMLS